MLVAMVATADGSLMVVVMIDPTRDPIAGVVRHGVGEATRFVGYAQLVAKTERQRELSATVAGHGEQRGVELGGGEA